MQLEILPLEEALFCEVNPIPGKYAMNVLGWNAGECRLPLVEPSDAHKAKIEQALQAAGLIKEYQQRTEFPGSSASGHSAIL